MLTIEMPPEPPPDFVAFVRRRLGPARATAARLTGSDRFTDEVYPDAFTDVALGWRWRRRWADSMLDRALARRAKRWREDQIYDVEVLAVHEGRPARLRYASVALRKAGWLAAERPLERPVERPVAEAAIAWVRAYRRWWWRRVARTVLAVSVTVAVIVQLLPGPTT